MSEVLTSLCSILLREYFGEIVQKVGTFLMKHVSSCSLYLIVKNVHLPLDKVRSSLSVLIQHGFCSFVPDEKGFAEYMVEQKDVLLLLYYERYAYCAHVLYGDPADLLIEEILNHGRLTMSEALQKVLERLQDAKDATGVDYTLKNIQEKFVKLVHHNFLQRCPYPHNTENHRMPCLSVADPERFLVPQIQLHLLENTVSEESPAKKQKIEHSDTGIYWKVHHERFVEHFRNEAIIQACGNHMDEKAAEVVKVILALSETKNNPLSPTTLPIPHHEILQRIQQTTNIKVQELDSYLAVLCEGTESFVSKADDRGGGMYVVNIKKIFGRLVESLAASVVQDRFGSKCARIFRILLAKKVLEHKQIEDVAMLHPKDTKEYIYKMFDENFIISHDVPKGSDFSHGQTFYLLHIDLVQVCQMLLERCYQALFNLVNCSEVQARENRRLLEKKQRIDAIVASLRQNGAEEEQIQEVQNIITPPEEAVIKKVTLFSQKIDSSQIQIAEMVLILTIFLEFSKCQ